LWQQMCRTISRCVGLSPNLNRSPVRPSLICALETLKDIQNLNNAKQTRWFSLPFCVGIISSLIMDRTSVWKLFEGPKWSLKFLQWSLKPYFYTKNFVVKPNGDGLRSVVSFSAWWVYFHDVTSCFSACGEVCFRAEHDSTFTPHHTPVKNR